MDLRPVSNREFLAFVKSHPEWKKSRIGKDLHDGDYLKRWEGDEAIKPAELDRPVSYVSFYAALSYCENSGKDLPKIYEYRVAASNTLREGIYVEYEKPYKPSKFDFMTAEWTSSTSSTISSTVDSVIVYSDGTIHDASTKPTDKKKTGSSLGFRCTQRPN
jgi:formylglycine-generating enzyme required for sulfatase activity